MCNEAIKNIMRQKAISSGSLHRTMSSGNVVTYNPANFGNELANIDSFKAAYPGFKGFGKVDQADLYVSSQIIEKWRKDVEKGYPNPERSVAADDEKR